MAKTRNPDRLKAELALCRDDPARFSRRFTGSDLWSKQTEVCESVGRYPITVVPAGRSVGKSFMLARLCLWWLYTRPNSLVITTGPDHRQVVTVLWKEIRRALQSWKRLNPHYPPGYVHMTEGVGSPQRLEITEHRKALGWACKTTEGFSGQHEPNLMVVIDEASGVADDVWHAIWGAAAHRYVIVGNPIRYDCHFRELFEKSPTPDINAVTISALDHPHAALETSPHGAVCASWLRQMREIHGEDSPWWKSNILGLFPGQESVRFIPAAWLDVCSREDITSDELWLDCPDGRPRMGVDVGGGVGADRSAIVVRNDKRLLDIFASEWHGVLDDARHRLEPIVVALAEKHGVSPDHVVFDQGGLGRSFGSYLASYGLPGCVGHFGAGRGGTYFANRRTANAAALRRRLDPHAKAHVPFVVAGVPAWPTLRQELLELRAPVQEWEEGAVKLALEPKEELAKRLKRSPDLLDALLMTFAI